MSQGFNDKMAGGAEQVGDKVDEMTGGKSSEQIDSAVGQAQEHLGGGAGQSAPAPEGMSSEGGFGGESSEQGGYGEQSQESPKGGGSF